MDLIFLMKIWHRKSDHRISDFSDIENWLDSVIDKGDMNVLKKETFSLLWVICSFTTIVKLQESIEWSFLLNDTGQHKSYFCSPRRISVFTKKITQWMLPYITKDNHHDQRRTSTCNTGPKVFCLEN